MVTLAAEKIDDPKAHYFTWPEFKRTMMSVCIHLCCHQDDAGLGVNLLPVLLRMVKNGGQRMKMGHR